MSQNINSDNYIGSVFSDRYEILELIGEGGMAVVYKALDRRLARNVAIKILRSELSDDEEFVSRFASESHAVALLSHPNIVAVYDVSHNDDVEYIVMELISGITLKQYADKKGKINWKEVVHFSKQIASGLSHAHQRGIIHRDIKPQNIMLLQDGTIKVADFGIAALENEFSEKSGVAMGSLNYISPEQTRGMGPDARSDIYSLGIVMYELICGQKPYNASTPAEVVVKQAEAITPVNEICSDVPNGLVEIINKAMCLDVNERYQSAKEFNDALDEFTVQYLKSEGKYKGQEPVVSVKPEVNIKGIEYLKLLKRSSKVSFRLGSFGLITASVLVFAFLWNFWLSDIFSPAERIELPNFVGTIYSDLVSNAEINSRYNFKVENVVDTKVPSGTVLSQNPEAGRSLMIIPGGIEVELKVSTGFILTEVPNLVGYDYREAVLKLQNAGFIVEINNITSDTVEKDIVISTSPAPGELITAGSTVYLDVSGGAHITYIKVPNVIGLTEDAAISKIQSRGLAYGGTSYEESEYEAGTVISQTLTAFTEVEERTSLSIVVSTGPSFADVSNITEVVPDE